jgi:molybdopterin/thiamine biosynthesis adenylyltransferase
VLIVGAGGLGAPAALYLAAAGVGSIFLADPDDVDRSNLQRQVIYTEADIGAPKVEAAADRLHALNPHVFVAGYNGAFDPGNADELVEGVDVVLDGTDDFGARFCVNDACVRHGNRWCPAPSAAGPARSACSAASPATAAWSRRSRPMRRPASPWAWWGRWPA